MSDSPTASPENPGDSPFNREADGFIKTGRTQLDSIVSMLDLGASM
jgi:hypothetical protein